MGDDNDSETSEDTSSEDSSSGDSYSETSSQSWGERLMESIKGVLVGVILFIAAFPVLVWNEGDAVKTAKDLKEGAANVATIPSASVDASKNGKLVHMTGQAVTTETLTDGVFNITQAGIRLERKVEMFQWQEEKKETKQKKVGGREETKTTYNYKTVWSTTAIDSSKFKVRQGHTNPGMNYQSETFVAQDVKVGAYRLNKALIGQITQGEALAVTQADMAKLPDDIKAKAKLNNNGIYVGANPSNQQVGDLKISYTLVKPQMVTIVAQQNNDTFEPYQMKASGKTIQDLVAGEKSSQAIFGEKVKSSETMTWVFRVVGFILMFAGISMIFKPLVTLGDVVPFVGSILGMGVSIVAFAISLPLTLITIALAWVAYRPYVGIPLLVVAVGVFVGIYMMAKKKKAAAAA